MCSIRHVRRFLVLLVVLAAWSATLSCAGVVVVSNRSNAKVAYKVVDKDGSADVREILPYASDMLPTADTLTIELTEDGETRRYEAAANSIQYFHRPADKTRLVQVNLPGVDNNRTAPGYPTGKLLPVLKIPVMLLVDENEPAVRRLWEKRLRDRLQAASAIFEKTCRVRFEAVAVGTWISDDAINDFDRSLAEFEAKVNPAPARLAIGFTSQYQIPKGQTHLGGTRGPFASHVLIREWSNHVTQRERLEILVHELGHYLGAAHCAESFSVMRPLLGDRQANAKDFLISFDPGNTFAMSLICEQVAASGTTELGLMPANTKDSLRGVYRALEQAIPNDPAAPQCLALLDRDPVFVPRIRFSKSLIDATRMVVQAITAAAETNARLPLYSPVADAPTRAEGDQLLEVYVRAAGKSAGAAPQDVRTRAFLLGLGIAIDHSNALREVPLLGDLARVVESDKQRDRRLAAIGMPSVHRRRDLAQHFVVSCALTAITGPQAAESLGIAREVQDSIGGTGLSFRDLSADLAGTAFAAGVLSGKLKMAALTGNFTVADFLPDSTDLPEGLSWHELSARYGSIKDDRFAHELSTIRQQIAGLSGYTLEAP